MSQTYSVSDLRKVAKHELAPPPCDDTLQIVVDDAHDGMAHGKWNIDRSFINGLGVVMGGFISAAADIMMAYAIASKLSDDQGFASIDLHTTFHRPATEGEVQVTAHVERLGRSVAYVTAHLTQNEKKVATCVSSVLVYKLKQS